MNNKQLRFGSLITFDSLTKNETQILLGREGILNIVAWDSGDYVWKVNYDVIGNDCPNFMECLKEKVDGKMSLLDEIVEDLKNALKIDFTNSLKILNAELEEAVKIEKNRNYSKMKNENSDCNVDGLTNEVLNLEKLINSSPVFSEFGLDSSVIAATITSFQEIIRSFLLFEEYEKEFQRIYLKLMNIPGENEQIQKSRKIFKQNNSLIDQGLMLNGDILQEDFRMDRDQVIKLMSKEYTGFTEMIEDLV